VKKKPQQANCGSPLRGSDDEKRYKMKGAFALLLLIGAVFAAAWFVDFTMSPAERQALATQSQWRSEQWRSADAAEKAIKQTLRDPDSAKFDRESVHYRCDPKPVNPCIPVVAVCGELNAKKRFRRICRR
jgi:hypothetical protein